MKAAGFEMVHERDMALDPNQVHHDLHPASTPYPFNTKQSILKTKHSAHNTQHQTPNTKHQTPNTKHKVFWGLGFWCFCVFTWLWG